MSLSVERLKEILVELESDWRDMCMSPLVTAEKLRKIADEQAAIRELIAIKEAEPDAIVLKGMMGLETLVPNIGYTPKQGDKLIRKPE